MSNSKLLVVESPTKARTIGKYLGKEYQVIATVGHLRDLPSSKMGVDLKTFEVDYQVEDKKKKVVAELVAAAGKNSEVLLATDPDREGEAIAWHVQWLMENSKQKIESKKISRISFHEITKNAVEEAIKNKGEVNSNLVNAQQGRRILDRVVGYSLSPVLWKKVRRGLSAGRVQSVAVRLICEREVEIEKFIKEKFFKILAEIKAGEGFGAELIRIEGKKVATSARIDLFDGSYSYSRSIFKNRKEADEFVAGLTSEFVVEKVDAREVERNPLPPYTTSKLQQAAARKMGWSGKQTMSVAQKLYEQGLITYHRTDSVYLSGKAIEEFRNYILKNFGEKYLGSKVRVFKNTSKNAQEAHEAIRPTTVGNTGKDLEGREKKLYEIIWKRAVATQAAAARMKNTTVTLSNGKGTFVANGVNILFDGFWKISGEKHEDQILPEMKSGDRLGSKKIWVEESETSPPPRYSDASLVSSLEKQGIGRPSTYAPIISTILARQYVDRDEGKFKPTSLGVAVNTFLVKNFREIVSLPFTAEMEEDLDEVALGKAEWKSMMKKFWTGFEPEIKRVEKEAERVKVEAEKTGEKCPECGEGELVIRLGRFGKFISCGRFPDCKYTKPYKEIAGFKCPECGGEGVVKRTKTGRKFFGCSNWPNCKWAGWKKP